MALFDSGVRDTLARQFSGSGTADLSPHHIEATGFRAAAVLVPLLNRPQGITLLFLKRSQKVSHHRGEIAFPGGAAEPGETPAQTALRECHEEVGIPPASVEVLGGFQPFPTITSFLVTPLVGWVERPPAQLTLQTSEVDECFEIPLMELMGGQIPVRRELTPWNCFPRNTPVAAIRAIRCAMGHSAENEDATPIYFFECKNRVIWGFTGEILHKVIETMQMG